MQIIILRQPQLGYGVIIVMGLHALMFLVRHVIMLIVAAKGVITQGIIVNMREIIISMQVQIVFLAEILM